MLIVKGGVVVVKPIQNKISVVLRSRTKCVFIHTAFSKDFSVMCKEPWTCQFILFLMLPASP